ncbi:5-cytosine rRNA methyltransferase NSUN4-like [Diadema antillarum]|uniref:5-cytosine rRNA methyltransferase NSUN4-like n=1 Tax=Diadema antillarum TaxID=105358 RepID=UPI003A88E5B0
MHLFGNSSTNWWALLYLCRQQHLRRRFPACSPAATRYRGRGSTTLGHTTCCRGKKTRAKLVYGKRKNDPTELALKHFDQNYRPIFGEQWPSVRLGLLSMPKYGALLNNYSDTDYTVEKLHSLGLEDFVQPCVESTIAHIHQRKKEANDMDEEYEASALPRQLGDEREVRNYDVAASDVQEREIIGLAEEEDADDLDVEERRPEAALKPWWEDKYIVAPGYEHRMELIHQMEMEERGGEEVMGGAPPIIDLDSVDIKVSPHLRCFLHRDDPAARLPPAKKCAYSQQLQYYIMDAASVLPIVAMGIMPDDVVLDLCAAPGGKSLAILQTMLVGSLTANEKVSSRRRRLQEVFGLYLPRMVTAGGAVNIAGEDGCEWGQMEPAGYDKVLVDVPCTTDRVSASVGDNNIFGVRRSRERLSLPKLQTELLCAGLEAVKPGGTVVYSTCTISPLQNDGVVQSAVTKCQEELDIGVSVVDLSPMAVGFSDVFNLTGCRYGQLVLPNILGNYGPMYFARLLRTS